VATVEAVAVEAADAAVGKVLTMGRECFSPVRAVVIPLRNGNAARSTRQIA